MTSPLPLRPPAARSRPAAGRRGAPRALRVVALLALAGACAGGVLLVVEVFLRSRVGAQVDQAVFANAALGRSRVGDGVDAVLDLVSVLSIAAATAVVAAVALLRRRVALALAAAVLVVGANVTTQLLKQLLVRPDFGLGTLNSLPSGHATVAASVGAALVLVVPPRLRPLAASLATAYAAVTGVATLSAGWHRPSDVVAAFLVTLGWGALVAAALVLLGADAETPPAVGSGHPATVVLLGLGALGACAAAAAALLATASRLPIETRLGGAVAYGGGVALVVATALAVVAVWLVAVSRGLRTAR